MPPRGFGLLQTRKLRNPLPTHWTFLSPEITGVAGQECAGFGCRLCWVGCPHKAWHKREDVLGTGFRTSQVQPQKIHYPFTCEKPKVNHSWKYLLGAKGLHESEKNWEGQPSHLHSVEVWGKGDARNQCKGPSPSMQSTAACIALSQCQIQHQCRIWPRTINKFICCRA